MNEKELIPESTPLEFESGDIVAIKVNKYGWVTAVCQAPSKADGGPVFYSLQIAAESDYIGILECEAHSPFISLGEFADVVLLEKKTNDRH